MIKFKNSYLIFLVFLFFCNNESEILDNECLKIYEDTIKELRIDEIEYPSPFLPGSKIVLKGNGFVDQQVCIKSEYILRGNINSQEIEINLTPNAITFDEIQFDDVIETIDQEGNFSGKIIITYTSVVNGLKYECDKDLSFDLVKYLSPEITAVSQGDVYLNDFIVVEGNNFLIGNEGKTVFRFSGDIVSNNSSKSFKVDNIEIQGSNGVGETRSKTGFYFSPDLTHLEFGSFSGTVEMCNIHKDGKELCAQSENINYQIKETKFLGFSPQNFSLGQIVSILGKGFVGGDRGKTIIELNGYIISNEGKSVPIVKDIIPTFIDGSSLSYSVTVVKDLNLKKLLSSDFNVTSGDFEGEITIRVMYDSYESSVGPFDLAFSIEPLKQIIWIRFMDDFSDTLELFGLRAVGEEIKDRIFKKIERIYEDVNIEFRTDEPTDYYELAYSILDIGGRDPNELGLFGNDNASGKDSYNLNLAERMGGVNAVLREDGKPEYGGVFLESFLFYSEHPELDYTVEPGLEPEPQFDEIFDPVRYNEIKAGEYPDGASSERIEQIEEAIRVLSNIIGDTVAHEIGHCLGLSNPDISNGSYHNLIPCVGCLMDPGSSRPFEERAELNNNSGAFFTEDDLLYFEKILPKN